MTVTKQRKCSRCDLPRISPYTYCRDHRNEAARKFYHENKERLLKNQKRDREKNKEKYQAASARYRNKNRELINSRIKARREKNPEAFKVIRRRCNLKKMYGLTEAAYESLLIGQAFGCAICGRQQGSSSRKRLFVDHSHITKIVRGLLCHRCNFLIGLSGDNPELLSKAINYLKKG